MYSNNDEERKAPEGLEPKGEGTEVCAVPWKVDQKEASTSDLSRWVNRVHCGDALALMAGIPSGSIPLVVTSPPYNLKNSTGNGLKDCRGGKWPKAALQKGYATHSDDMPHAAYVAWQRDCLTEMLRIIPDDGAIFYIHKCRVQNRRLQNREDILTGFPVIQRITWHRRGGINFNRQYFLPTTEDVYLILKDGFQLAPGANALTDVWDIPQERDNPHPAPFPVALAQRCITATTAGIVLDPFLGSGTTAIAAEACGRRWIGLEVSREYCRFAKRRIRRARKQRATEDRHQDSEAGSSQREFWETDGDQAASSGSLS